MIELNEINGELDAVDMNSVTIGDGVFAGVHEGDRVLIEIQNQRSRPALIDIRPPRRQIDLLSRLCLQPDVMDLPRGRRDPAATSVLGPVPGTGLIGVEDAREAPLCEHGIEFWCIGIGVTVVMDELL